MNDDTDDNKGEDIAQEQAADLAALQAAANGAPAGQGAAPAGPAEPEELPPPSAAAMGMARMIVTSVRPLLGLAFPPLREAPAEAWEPVPEGLAVLLDHYGASPDWMRSPWARFAGACVPLGGFVAVQYLNKPKPAALEDATPAPPPPGALAEPGARTVTMGTVEPVQ